MNVKIFNFVNLVCWEEISNLIDHNTSDLSFINYVDSVSLKILSFFFGRNTKLMPGAKFIKNLVDEPNLVVFASGKEKISISNLVINLPENINSFEEIKFSFSKLKIYDEKIGNLIIGISSPKQNKFALEMANFFLNQHGIKSDEIVIYCLGATVDWFEKNKNKNITSFLWLSFLKNSPFRTLFKIYLTFKEILKITFIKNHQRKFLSFLNVLEK